MKNALFFASYGAPYEGNFICSLRNLEANLAVYGFSVIYLFPERAQNRDWPAQLKNENNEIVFLPDSKIKAVQIIGTLLKNKDIRFVHTHFVGTYQMSALKLAKLFAGNKGKKLKIICHFHNPYLSENSLKGFLTRCIFSGNYILTCGAKVRDSALAAGFHNDVQYIDNCIDFERFTSFEPFPFDPDKFQILMFGHDYRRKGVDLAIDACRRLIESGKHLQLNICLSKNKEQVQAEIIKTLGIMPEWITLLPPRNDIATYYHGVDLFISPSRSEGLCYSIIEASYCQCAVVASDIFGQKEITIDGLLWCKPENAPDLAGKICNVMELSPEEYQKRTESMKQAAQAQYSIERWVSDVENYYKQRNLLQ